MEEWWNYHKEISTISILDILDILFHQAYDYPADVGLPIGTDQDPDFVIMETHYDNPGLRSGIIYVLHSLVLQKMHFEFKMLTVQEIYEYTCNG